MYELHSDWLVCSDSQSIGIRKLNKVSNERGMKGVHWELNHDDSSSVAIYL